TPRTFEYILKKCKRTPEDTQRILDELTQVGVAKVWTDRSDVKPRYFVNIFAQGMLEMMVNNREQLAAHPEIGRAFEEYTRRCLAPMVAMFPEGMAMMHIIPVEDAVKDDPGGQPLEKLSYYLDKYDTFSVSDCSCRQSRKVMGDGCGHLDKDICIQMGTGAEYYIKTGRWCQISREEAEEILKFAEDNGLMHEMPATEELGESAAICNCCSCSCFSMRLATYFGTPDAIRSNYTAVVEPLDCVACGQCVENCPTNALKLGHSLCATKPVAPKKPAATARDHAWSEKNWNVDYRTNREDVAPEGTAPAKRPVRPILPFRAISSWQPRGAIWKPWSSLKKKTPSRRFAAGSVPMAVRMNVPGGILTSPSPIDEIKKFIADKELDTEKRFVPKKRYHLGNKIAIIGGGPAGLACAYYLALDDYAVTVFEREEKLGGMLAMGIPAFRLEKDVLDAEIDVLCQLGIQFKTGVNVGEDITLDNLRAQGYEAFYLAIGAQGGRQLGIDGEDAQGVMTGVDFLRQAALGQKPEISGKVVVIGGGNVAIDVARTATRESVDSVQLFCLESPEEMPALDEEIHEAKADAVAFNNGWGPKSILNEDGAVVGVEFMCCIQVFDAEGHFAPQYDAADTLVVDADTVLVSVGQSIEWGSLLAGSTVETGRGNTVQADDFTYQTAQTDVFVGGDCYTGPQFAINAIAAGKEG
ncbi:FAD-dependent oxidoreductase, partial [Eubacterium aggregans]|uniref:FAD-dependent oxidoreductase n=1 Tax=Eubacterium aggregans TaxID=81409 RepID=UPI003F2FCE47